MFNLFLLKTTSIGEINKLFKFKKKNEAAVER